MKLILALVTVLMLLTPLPSDNLRDLSHIYSDIVFEKLLPPFLHKINVLPFSDAVSKPVDDKCVDIIRDTLKSLKSGLLETTFDSFGKIPNSILKGSIQWLGDYDSCLNSNYFSGVPNNYCMLNVTFKNRSKIEHLGLSLTSGICLPSNCSPSPFNDIANSFLNTSLFQLIFPLDAQLELKCLQNTELDSVSIACLCVIAILFLLCTFGTILDIRKVSKKSDFETKVGDVESKNEPEKTFKTVVYGFVTSFSIMKSLSSLSQVSTNQNRQRVSCLDGIRVLSFGWIALGHIVSRTMRVTGNLSDIIGKNDLWHFKAVTGGNFGVDTFFLLSGFLLAYSFLKNQTSVSCLSILLMYLYRFLRLTPTYGFVLFFYASIWKHFGEGPFWNFSVDQKTEICRTTWWYNLLYVTNISKLQGFGLCMNWSWYLTVDTQLFVISPVFLVFLKRKNPPLGFVILGVLWLVSTTASFCIFYRDNISIVYYNIHLHTAIDTLELLIVVVWFYLLIVLYRDTQRVANMYTMPHVRCGPFLVGCLLAFILRRIGNNPIKIKKIYLIVGWIISAFLSLSLIYGINNRHIGRTGQALYNALGRTAWGLSVAWIIFLCSLGLGGKINSFLSWSLWTPLSRLSFCAYLCHVLLLSFYFQNLRNSFNFTLLSIIPLYCGVLILSFMTSLVLFILVESPFSRLQARLR